MNTTREANGTFKKVLLRWTPELWDDGWVNGGRFLVYRPDYPRANMDGYAFRSHVVYWLNTGEVPSSKMELHHKNKNKLDDRFENLILLTHSQHQSEHRANWVTITCIHCGKTFREHAWRASKRNISFCSQKCYHDYPRTIEHKAHISNGLKLAYQEGRR